MQVNKNVFICVVREVTMRLGSHDAVQIFSGTEATVYK